MMSGIAMIHSYKLHTIGAPTAKRAMETRSVITASLHHIVGPAK
jgi:hypothetical protein